MSGTAGTTEGPLDPPNDMLLEDVASLTIGWLLNCLSFFSGQAWDASESFLSNMGNFLKNVSLLSADARDTS